MPFIRLCPMTNTECTKKCHMVCIKRIAEDDQYTGDIKVTYATNQDGTKEIVDSQSFHIKNPSHTEQQELYERMQKAQTAIGKYMFHTKDVGEIPLNDLVRHLQELPECLAYAEGVQSRKLIILVSISNALKFYIDRKQP